jgi:hypothetical protein
LAKKRAGPRRRPLFGNLLPRRFLGSTWGTRTRSEGNQTNPGCILIAPRCDSWNTAFLQARLRLQVRDPGGKCAQSHVCTIFPDFFVPSPPSIRHLQPESPRHNVGVALIVLATLISHAQPDLPRSDPAAWKDGLFSAILCTSCRTPIFKASHTRNFVRNPGFKLSTELDQQGFPCCGDAELISKFRPPTR